MSTTGEIKIDLGLTEERLGELVGAAILSEVGPEGRERILAQTMAFLLEPKPAYSGDPKPVSPLQRAFQYAAMEVVRALVTEMVEENAEFKAKLRVVVGEAVLDFINDGSEQRTRAIREAVANTLMQAGRF